MGLVGQHTDGQQISDFLPDGSDQKNKVGSVQSPISRAMPVMEQQALFLLKEQPTNHLRLPTALKDGHYQILFLAESETQLLKQLRGVPVEDYQEQRKQQARAEAPRQFLAQLHRDPEKVMLQLAAKYTAHFSKYLPPASNIA